MVPLPFFNQVKVSMKANAHRRSWEFKGGYLLVFYLYKERFPACTCKKLKQGKFGSCKVLMKSDETIWDDLNLNSRTSFSQREDTGVKWQPQAWWHEECPNKLTAQSNQILKSNQVDFQAQQIRPLF